MDRGSDRHFVDQPCPGSGSIWVSVLQSDGAGAGGKALCIELPSVLLADTALRIAFR